jgi:site-specific DNA-adenine methylase
MKRTCGRLPRRCAAAASPSSTDRLKGHCRTQAKGDFIYCDPPYAPSAAPPALPLHGDGFTLTIRNGCSRRSSAPRRGAHVVLSNSSAPES